MEQNKEITSHNITENQRLLASSETFALPHNQSNGIISFEDEMLTSLNGSVEIPADNQQGFYEIARYVLIPLKLRDEAKRFALWEVSKIDTDEETRTQKRKDVTDSTYQALVDLHKIRTLNRNEDLQIYRSQHDNAEQLERLYDTVAPVAAEEITQEIPEWGPRKKLGFFLRTKSVISGADEEEKEYIFKNAGYSGDELKTIMKQLGKSGATSIPIATGYEAIGIAVAGLAAKHAFLGDISDAKTLAVIAATYGGYWATLFANGYLNIRWLRNNDIGWCPNGLAAAGYYLSKGLAPENTKLQNTVTLLSSVGMDVVKESGWYGVGILSTSGFAGANAAGIALNGTQALTMAAVDRKPERMKPVSNILKKTTEPAFRAKDKVKKYASDTAWRIGWGYWPDGKSRNPLDKLKKHTVEKDVVPTTGE